MKIFRIPFSGGILELKQTAEGEEATFTPLKELPVFSLVKGTITKKAPLLGGFFVHVPEFGEFFMPQAQALNAKVGDNVLVQVVRESLENKPPLVSTKILFPFCGCYVVFDNKSRVKILDGKDLLKVFKEFSDKWKVSLTVYNAKRCLSNLSKLENIVKYLRSEAIGPPFIWKGFYTFLLEECGGEVFVPNKELCLDLEPFEELTGFKIPCKEVSLKKLLKEVEFSKFSNYLFSQIKTFEGGYLITGEVGGITVIDVNGYGSKVEINQNALREIVRFIKTHRVGGIIVIDFAGLKVEQNLKEELKKLLAPYRCSVRGFTNSGLFEIVCPKMGPSVRERLSVYSSSCETFIKSDKVLIYEILENLPQTYIERILIKLNPLRKDLPNKFNSLAELKAEFTFDWQISINKFLIEF